MSKAVPIDSEIRIIPFEQFIPLIKDVSKIVKKVTEIYIEAILGALNYFLKKVVSGNIFGLNNF